MADDAGSDVGDDSGYVEDVDYDENNEEGDEKPPTTAQDSDAEVDDAASESGEVRASRPELSRAPAVAKETILNTSNRIRNIVLVPREEWVTSDIMQRHEYASVIANRAAQISRGSAAFVDTAGLHCPIAIATKELYARKSPLIIRRIVGDDGPLTQFVEDRPAREMVLPPKA